MCPMDMLKNNLQCVLGSTLQKYCACQRKCRSTAPASKSLLGTDFLQACARFSLVSSALELPPTVHVFGVEPCGWSSTSQDALSTGESPSVLSTNAAYSVSVMLRELALRRLSCAIVRASRNPTLPGWQRWKNLDPGCSRSLEAFNWHTWMLLFDRQTRPAETKPGRQERSSRNKKAP